MEHMDPFILYIQYFFFFCGLRLSGGTLNIRAHTWGDTSTLEYSKNLPYLLRTAETHHVPQIYMAIYKTVLCCLGACIFNTMATGVLATQGARESAELFWLYFPRIFPSMQLYVKGRLHLVDDYLFVSKILKALQIPKSLYLSIPNLIPNAVSGIVSCCMFVE